MFVSTHVVLAKACKTPELEITDAEGETFLKACENVARHYSVSTTQKTLDWLALLGAGVQIYGTRAMVIISDKKKPEGKVIPIRSVPLSVSQPGPDTIIPTSDE